MRYAMARDFFLMNSKEWTKCCWLSDIWTLGFSAAQEDTACALCLSLFFKREWMKSPNGESELRLWIEGKAARKKGKQAQGSWPSKDTLNSAWVTNDQVVGFRFGP